MHTEITYFSVAMFLALAVLLNWKRRRDVVAARLNRGLCGYAATRTTAQPAAPDGTHGENLIPV